jgi:glycosyltransferase involved in cell wall biosynthesis
VTASADEGTVALLGVVPADPLTPVDARAEVEPDVERPKLSVVVPAYRDGERIVGSITRLVEALTATGLRWEVVVVVDGDAETFRHAATMRSSAVHVVGYADNRGKGFALRYGMSLVTGELVTFIDSDMEIGPEEIGRMAQVLRLYEADVVVGSKRHPLSKVQYPRTRRIQSLCYQLLIRVLFRVSVRDTQTGLKMMRREVALKVLDVALVKRFAFDLELLALAHHFGYRRIIETPVVISYKFSSTTNVRAVCSVLWDTLAIFYRMHLRHWYDKQPRAGLSALQHSLPTPLVLAEVEE